MDVKDIDFGMSVAKLASAKRHSETLKHELRRVGQDRRPYTFSIGEVDPDSGWCDITMKIQRHPELGIGSVIGDYMTNLRSALNFMVNDLARASGVAPSRRHKFPIYSSADAYAKEVGSATAAKPKGPLGGIVHGLGVIEAVQPYNIGPNARDNPLTIIQRYSNSDKHVEVAQFDLIVHMFLVRVEPEPLEQVDSAPRLDAVGNGKYLARRVRFAPPFPTHPTLDAKMNATPAFITGRLGMEAPQAITVHTLGACYGAVNFTLGALMSELDPAH